MNVEFYALLVVAVWHGYKNLSVTEPLVAVA